MVNIILKITGHVLDENKGRFDIIVNTLQQSMKKNIKTFFFNFTILKKEHHY